MHKDQRLATQSETRFVRWPWCGREEMVTLTGLHWAWFDDIVRRRRITDEALHREISQEFPRCKKLWGAITIYLERIASRMLAEQRGTANDNDPYHPKARSPIYSAEERQRRRPRVKQPLVLPIVKSSPFKPIARAKRLYAEQ